MPNSFFMYYRCLGKCFMFLPCSILGENHSSVVSHHGEQYVICAILENIKYFWVIHLKKN